MLPNIYKYMSVKNRVIRVFERNSNANRKVNDVNHEDNYIRTVQLTYADLLDAKLFQYTRPISYECFDSSHLL